jgi:hypothetical protein
MIVQSGYTVLFTKAVISDSLELKYNFNIRFYAAKLVLGGNFMFVENELFEQL